MRLASLALLLIAGGCRTADETVLPWCTYRRVTTPGGSGIWGGSSYAEVLVRRSWGWSTVLDGKTAPGRPVVLTPTTVLVFSNRGTQFLHQSDSEMPQACGDRKAIVTVPPGGGVVDCADHLAGPAAAIATSLRVRRVDPTGRPVAQQEFTAGDPGRVFLSPAVTFYDSKGTPYLVTFRDPWAQTLPDGSRQSGTASPERLAQIACELIAVGPTQTPPIPAPAGHEVSDCSSAEFWSRALGRELTATPGFQR